ncbi:hypothetical protein SBOR_8151 [Sclerotinia borealis F-4128]|uniref:Uncharacterized protein n=1 Tax=Sclerotinia borealis (strain F-4128) TaxID=1432307 RepID=W9C6I0_SCLBF|nr:hypothetical protein SBOR_8151 [Sclerotinia borealis F-4128]
MVRPKEDRKIHLHRVASSNLPLIPRKSWEYYVAILQPGIPLEKCDHGDFLWMKVMGTTTIERILTMHLRRTGRNSVLMDGDIGLTIDTKVGDMQCLGLGVYAFWEIVKVERWWEYTVRSADADQRLRAMREERRRSMLALSTRVDEELGVMEEGIPRRRPRNDEILKREAVEEVRGENLKRTRWELEGETEEMAERRKKGLYEKLEVMRLKTENAPPIDTLNKVAESTNVQLRVHDYSVVKQRQEILKNAKKIGPKFEGMLQRFEISWERQRQDIINRDPQFRRSRQAIQAVANVVQNHQKSIEHIERFIKAKEDERAKQLKSKNRRTESSGDIVRRVLFICNVMSEADPYLNQIR